MRKTVKLALEKGVGIGAHPGFQDLTGFGRRNLHVTPREAYEIVIYQIGALYGFVKAEGAEMQHVKPHGALFNMAATDVIINNYLKMADFMASTGDLLQLLKVSDTTLNKNISSVTDRLNKLDARVKKIEERFNDKTYNLIQYMDLQKNADDYVNDFMHEEIGIPTVIRY